MLQCIELRIHQDRRANCYIGHSVYSKPHPKAFPLTLIQLVFTFKKCCTSKMELPAWLLTVGLIVSTMSLFCFNII